MTITASTASGQPASGAARARTAPSPSVMHVLTSLEIGGAEMLVLELLAHQPDDAAHNCVVTLRRRGPLAERVEALGVAVHSLDVPASQGALAIARALRRVVQRVRPDVIHSHNSSPLIAAALATALAPRVRLVHTEHGRSSTGSRAARIALRLASRRANAIVAVSNDTAAWARDRVGMPGDKIHVIRNGVPNARAGSASTTAGIHAAVTVARFEKVKDLGTMIRAVPLVLEQLPDFQLHLFGDGSERAALSELSRSLRTDTAVTFHGMSSDVPSALAHGRVFLSSSVSEGISLTILEAMSASLPIVATAVGGTPELVTDRLNGRLVPLSDPAALAAAIVDVLADPDAAAAMGRASRDRATRDYSMDAMVSQYRQLYQAS